jgi:hypothetical protein
VRGDLRAHDTGTEYRDFAHEKRNIGHDGGRTNNHRLAHASAFAKASLGNETPRRRADLRRGLSNCLLKRYFIVYVNCRPTIFTLLLYEPLIKPFPTVLPSF